MGAHELHSAAVALALEYSVTLFVIFSSPQTGSTFREWRQLLVWWRCAIITFFILKALMAMVRLQRMILIVADTELEFIG